MERLSESERSELWDRWEAGESQRSIASALDRSPSTIRTQLLSSGWRRPVPHRETVWHQGLSRAANTHRMGLDDSGGDLTLAVVCI